MMRVVKIIAVVLVLAAVVGWLGYTFRQAYRPGAERIQGQIEAQQYAISSKVAGRIDKVLVREGDTVRKGQLVFSLISPEIEAKLAQAKGGRDAADALAQQAEKGARSQQIEAARDQWRQAETAVKLLEKTFNRLDSLYRDGVLAEQKRDEVQAQLQAARHSADAARQVFLMTEEGSRDEEKKAAAGTVRMAAGAVAEIEAYAADTRITSWNDGEVSQVLLQSGELAPQGFPVVTILDMQDVWAVLHIREDLLQNFAKGSEFTVSIPALGQGTHIFRVSHVAPMGDFAVWRATQADKGFDMRSFEIEARPVKPLKDLRVGMSVLVEK